MRPVSPTQCRAAGIAFHHRRPAGHAAQEEEAGKDDRAADDVWNAVGRRRLSDQPDR
jgi:hypothetical protein